MKPWNAVLETQASPAATLTRVAVGSIMFPHGAQHLLGWFGGYGFNGTLEWMVGAGFPAPLAALAIVTEFVAPLMLILGIATRLAALGVAGIMAGAILTHLPNGFFMNWFGSLPAGAEGFEYHLLVLFMSVALIIEGSGALSVDRWLIKHQPGRGLVTKLGVLSLVLVLAACSDDQVSDPIEGGPRPVASVTVQPDTLTLLVGETRALQAVVKTTDGTIVHDRVVTWTSGDALIATVSGDGIVSAHRPGIVTVNAASGTRTGVATLRVVRPAPVVARVEVSPAPFVLNVGESRQLSVRLFAADNSEIPAPPAGQIQWNSLNPGTVSVNAGGIATAHSGGEVQIQATFMNVTGTTFVTVPAFVLYTLRNAPIKFLEYDVASNHPNVRLVRSHFLKANEFRIGTNNLTYQQRFIIEIYQTTVFADGSTITGLLDTVTVDDAGSASQIVGVGDFVFHSARTGAIFFGRRGATSLEVEQNVPGGHMRIPFTYSRN